MVVTAADGKSEVFILALKCFSLEGTPVTLTYNLLVRISHMALRDYKGSGQCGEGGFLVGCTDISVTVTSGGRREGTIT